MGTAGGVVADDVDQEVAGGAGRVDPPLSVVEFCSPDLSRIEYRYDDGRGNLTSFLDATGTTTLTYDVKDRLERIYEELVYQEF